uniref:Calcineurin-like phosphoesterase domain-containing protein n=1 Tax=Chromera velia CCMP2878 TaxID=1169474 RepID=A0A0G4IDE4_9ALVE|eukprot:Cvel_13403.t1-p1 / transcript=Cvel_13403.t1 / gene=Cvel_13403 / organism=Chromera_velia_CCMP2878 / gene_product=Metallophosphoesterase domain-containing protein 1, putative / transcript_product=Metallophosphoesterase domain-containing protein 1, putative / location=Cvel_scaffold913:52128-55272(-) / protein_length=370 / sequence_SO=supercontig / SO=protein_coding / is_pseudo=false
MSDTHNLHEFIKVPPGDVFIHCGDFTQTGGAHEVSRFCEWVKALPHEHTVVIGGNHDLILEEGLWEKFHKHRFRQPKPKEGEAEATSESMKALTRQSCTAYLEDEAVEIRGVKFYGSPYSPRFHDWAFNIDRGRLSEQKWMQIPKDTDVLITHGPPLGRMDKCFSGQFAGCEDLLKIVQQRVKPSLHLFGHIHESHGLSFDGHTVYANAANVNLQYDPHFKPFVFDIPLPLPGSSAKSETAVAAEEANGKGQTVASSKVEKESMDKSGPSSSASTEGEGGRRRLRVGPLCRRPPDDVVAAQVRRTQAGLADLLSQQVDAGSMRTFRRLHPEAVFSVGTSDPVSGVEAEAIVEHEIEWGQPGDERDEIEIG